MGLNINSHARALHAIMLTETHALIHPASTETQTFEYSSPTLPGKDFAGH
jgi:hypothetical protein